MKKNFKLVLALVLALTLVLGGMSAFADPADTTLKISNPVDGHTYTAYQLFVGDLANGKLSNVKWGTAAKTTAITFTPVGESTTKTITPVAGELVDEDFLAYLETLAGKTTATDTGIAQETANYISTLVDFTKTGVAITSTDVTVKTGYYVIKDAYTNTADPTLSTLSTNVVTIVGPTSITNKAGTTQHEKEVLDINDTEDTALDLSNLKNLDTSSYSWSDSADYDFNDVIPFKLTTTVASDFAKYDEYFLKVYDSMGKGLRLNADSIKVYVDGKEATKSTATDADGIAADKAAGKYILTTDTYSFNVQFDKLNAITGVAAGSKVVVYYTATLTKEEGIVYGNPGIKNESWVEFSNNPNGDQDGHGTTPKETAVVFTYQTIVNKTDGTKALEGAEFELKKLLKSGSYQTIAVVKFTKDGVVTTKVADGTTSSAGDATKFSFDGMDDGTYVLHETVTPAGYNTIADVTFKIVATHTASGTALVVKNSDGTDFTGDLTFTKISDEAGYSTDVVNKSGSTLPETGGIGTTIFYIAGSILVLAAAVLLITKRRMGSND